MQTERLVNAVRRIRRWVARARRSPLTWRHRGLQVSYFHDLDGGGSFAAADYARVIRAHTDQPFERGFEWCSGPGFIGFYLLEEGLARTFCFADINPRAVACVKRTVTVNDLGPRVAAYVSNNLESVPETEQFDLVVGNPPSYAGLNPEHPLYARFKDDLRPNDPNWQVHRRFFQTIRRHLRPGAMLFIAEVMINDVLVHTPGFDVPYDIRTRPPIEDFREMIAEAGLELLGVEPLAVLPGGFACDVMIIRNPTQ